MAQQYIITAYDFTDAQALDRRMAARPFHLEVVKKLKQSGNFLIGGAILNSEGKMVGSSVIVQFDQEKELQQWLREDPYATQQVWEKIEVKPFKVAEV
ncbi:YciI family protein [Adhaeribacter aquaticus]|uniref:YciI family protein n=1 Tax=Adhaeribacter aquaticus TaxID=299567 RepID=UPI0004012676|nr:YciI family protein [Adhaeribacter aquaticus]